MSNKKLIALICSVLLLVGAAGATLAWLTDDAGPVTNTFTVGDVGIYMDETNEDDKITGMGRDTENTYKMIPGYTIDKDPIIRLTADSEPCWVFVEVNEEFTAVKVGNETYTFRDYIDYGILEGWKKVDGEDNVYGMIIDDPAKHSTVATGLHVIGYDKDGDDVVTKKEQDIVAIKDTVTKEMMDAVTSNNYPKLTFKAYAVQLNKTNGVAFNAKEAWAAINAQN